MQMLSCDIVGFTPYCDRSPREMEKINAVGDAFPAICPKSAAKL
jgi:hypothetical protein